MDDSFWWLIVGLALFVVELLTPGFVVACFGVGALLASLIALFGGGLFWQVFAFSVGSIAALLLLRPLLNHGKKDASGAKIAPDKATGMDALKGRTVLVVKQIDEPKESVVLQWTAMSGPHAQMQPKSITRRASV